MVFTLSFTKTFFFTDNCRQITFFFSSRVRQHSSRLSSMFGFFTSFDTHTKWQVVCVHFFVPTIFMNYKFFRISRWKWFHTFWHCVNVSSMEKFLRFLSLFFFSSSFLCSLHVEMHQRRDNRRNSLGNETINSNDITNFHHVGLNYSKREKFGTT